jgi:hypothetical protein
LVKGAPFLMAHGIERYILGVSLIYKAKLRRTLVGSLVKTSVKGGRCWPIRLSNKGRRYLISSGLGVRPPY